MRLLVRTSGHGRIVLGKVLLLCLLSAPLSAQEEGFGFSGAQEKKEKANVADRVGSELLTNVYVVPPSFMALFYEDKSTRAAEGDPFAESAPNKVRKRGVSAKSLLEAAGITFGPGASAIYGKITSQIIIRNTREQLELVEAYFDSLAASYETNICVQVEIYEGATDAVSNLIRRHEGDGDQAEALEEARNGNIEETFSYVVSLVSSHRSGARGKAKSGYDIPMVKEYQREGDILLPVLESEFVGTSLEVDPVLGADNVTVHLSLALEHHFEFPEIRTISGVKNEETIDIEAAQFFRGTLSNTLTIMDGHTRILGVLPVNVVQGDEVADARSRVVFISVKLWRSGEVRKMYDERDLPPEPDE